MPMPDGLEIIKQAINSVEIVKEQDLTCVNIHSMHDNHFMLMIYFYYDPQSGMLRKKAKGLVQQAILKACKENNITIPYEHTALTVDHDDADLIDMARCIATKKLYNV